MEGDGGLQGAREPLKQGVEYEERKKILFFLSSPSTTAAKHVPSLFYLLVFLS